MTEAEICNLALVAIGHTQLIDDLNEDSTEAQVAKAVFAQSRDAVLERFMWKFATIRTFLADLGAAAARNGWRFAYALPTNCITPRAIVLSGVRAPSPAQRIPFDVEGSGALHAGNLVIEKRVLLTDQKAAELIYTARITSPSLWSPLFVDALSWKLASAFALGLVKKAAVAREMTQEFERTLMIAEAAQLAGSREDLPPPSEYITIRGG